MSLAIVHSRALDGLCAPQVAVEFGRKVLFTTERPGFLELEAHVKGNK